MKTILAIILATVCGLAIVKPVAESFDGSLNKVKVALKVKN